MILFAVTCMKTRNLNKLKEKVLLSVKHHKFHRREWRYNASYSSPAHNMVVSCPFHAPGTGTIPNLSTKYLHYVTVLLNFDEI
jgi:hypothetical protein